MGRLNLDHEQRSRLRRQLKATADVRLFRRMLAVLELDRGRSATDVARMLGVTRQSVCNWANAFARNSDPSVLIDAPRTGRPPRSTEAAEECLRLLMVSPPRDLGYSGENWTLRTLQQEMERRGIAGPSTDTIRRLLRRLGYVWKRRQGYVPGSGPRRARPPAAHPRRVDIDYKIFDLHRLQGPGGDDPTAKPADAAAGDPS
jgi:transposase